MGRGFAVIDVETTGLFPGGHDRIVEIGIVQMSPSGDIESSHETLVNPERDMGPQHIHGISAAAAARAPLFVQIAPMVAELLDGRVPVAHNASFDSRFLINEMNRVGLQVTSSDHWLCTMQMGGSSLGERQLAACCLAVGVPLTSAHSAGGDALATAELLAYYMRTVGDHNYWEAWLASAPPSAHTTPENHVLWVARNEVFVKTQSFMEQLVGSLSTSNAGPHLNLDYLALLDRILLDGIMSVSETNELVRLATELKLSNDDVQMAHRAYFDGLVSAAWADHILTAEETSEIHNAAKLLGIDEIIFATSIKGPSSEVPNLNPGFQLVPGDVVVLTGDMEKPREQWTEELTFLGLEVKSSTTKATKLLVAADPDSMSGKAAKARKYGITIVNEAGLEKLIASSAGLHRPT